jgi:hypothetical protein
MATFIHLAPEKVIKRIRRAGIMPAAPRGNYPAGVFALPVTPQFFVSHQWLRELRRGGQRVICGVYFRTADTEPVWIGYYNQPHVKVTAARAAAMMMETQGRLGFEVVIPRKILPDEIHRVRHLPQLVGWRYRPDSHRVHYCGCIACVGRGAIRGRIKNEKWEAAQPGERVRGPVGFWSAA